MAQHWRTKEDVLKDLEMVSGQRVTDVDDGYFVYGEQPPPLRAVDDEDDEFELMFGGAAAQGTGQGAAPGPDLMGITKMLRMVQKYENSSDEELPVTPNKKIVISKPNAYQLPSAEKKPLNLNSKSASPIKKNVTGKVSSNNNPSTDNTLNGRLSSNEEGSSEKITSNSELNSSIATSPANMNVGTNTETEASTRALLSSELPSPAKIITNRGSVFSKLNPNVKEFIPKSSPIASSQISYTTKGMTNINDTRITKVPNNDPLVTISNTKLVNEVDNSKILKDASAVKNEECSKEEKKQMAMMLKNQISTKNDTFENQQQTNKAIVNLLKLYANPKPAKPLKLLPPQFFEKCKATGYKDNIDNGIEEFKDNNVISINNANNGKNSGVEKFMENKMRFNKDSNGVNYKSNDIKEIHENKMTFNEDINAQNKNNGILELTENKYVYSKNNEIKEFEDTNMTFNEDITAHSETNSIKEYKKGEMTFNEGINDVYYKNNDFKENNSKKSLNKDMNPAVDDLWLMNSTYIDKKYDDVEELKENNHAISKQNDEIEKFNEGESTQLTPDMGDMNIDESNAPTEIQLDPYMKESISKVTNWLHDKPIVTVSEKSKSPMLYLGAVGYKRKDPVTCKSPSEVTENKVPKATEYKPSSYAEELHKKYSEKNKKNTPTLNIWEKLEADLKKKDLEVKNRKKKV